MSGQPARSFGSYELLGELGRGAFGRVLHARHRETGAERAIKVLATADPEARERFRREVAVLARVDGHPNLVRIHEATEIAGQLAYVMELVRGPSLRHRLAIERRLATDEAARITLGLARALEHCHRAGVLHRDVKPENVLLDESGTPKLADLGLARSLDSSALTKSGSILGTPHYMAPELFDGAQATPASDVYALGAVLYEMLSGDRTVAGNAFHEIAFRIAKGIAPLRAATPDVPPALEAVCARALQREPAARYPSAAALARDLELFLAGKPLLPVAGVRPGLGRVVGAIAAAGVVVLTALVFATAKRRSPGESPTPAGSPDTPGVAPVASERGTGTAPATSSSPNELVKDRLFLAYAKDLENVVAALETLARDSFPTQSEASRRLKELLEVGSRFPEGTARAPGVPAFFAQKRVWQRLLKAACTVFLDQPNSDALSASQLEQVQRFPVEGWQRAALLGILGAMATRSQGLDTAGKVQVRGLLVDPAMDIASWPVSDPDERRWRVVFYATRARILIGDGVPEDTIRVAEDGETVLADAGDDDDDPLRFEAKRKGGEAAAVTRLSLAHYFKETHQTSESLDHLERAERDYKRVLDLVARLADNDKDRVSARLQLVVIQGARGKWDEVRRGAEDLPATTSPELDARAKAIVALAAAIAGNGDAAQLAEEAVRRSKSLLESKRGVPEAYEASALVLARARQFDQARETLKTEQDLVAADKLRPGAFRFIEEVSRRIEELEHPSPAR